MGAAKYTAHDEMKELLRTYFPKRIQNEELKNNDHVIEEEEPQQQDIEEDGDKATYG